MILSLLEIPKDNKLNINIANLNQATIKNCDLVKDATKEAEKDGKKGPKVAEKDDKIENDGNKGPKPAEKLKKDEKYLESLREKAKG